jgi:hypothetical protein
VIETSDFAPAARILMTGEERALLADDPACNPAAREAAAFASGDGGQRAGKTGGARVIDCASGHSPQHAYGPPSDLPAMFGGPKLTRQGVRAVPSLTYLERQPNFIIGPDNEENETTSLTQRAAPIWCRRGASSRMAASIRCRIRP